MKKSLIALAVLAASSAAMAQSSVTLYGLADVWFGSVETDDGVKKQSVTQLTSGGVNTSRWGMKGSEDLGGGLKANFQLEKGFDLDTGGEKGSGFDRQAWVGLSGGFGDVAVGKVWTAYDDVNGASNAVFDSALSATNGVFVSASYEDNPANGFRYTSPTMSGFTAAVSYSLDEEVASGLAATSISLSYAAGPLAVQFGYQDESLNGGGTGYGDQTFMRLGASYDFGVAVAKVSYGDVKNVEYTNGLEATEYQIGVDIPLSPALTISANYAASEDDSAAVNDAERSGYGIAAAYTLSKRTFLYGGYRHSKTEVSGTPDNTVSVFAVGVQHKF
jgi:predicted porin